MNFKMKGRIFSGLYFVFMMEENLINAGLWISYNLASTILHLFFLNCSRAGNNNFLLPESVNYTVLFYFCPNFVASRFLENILLHKYIIKSIKRTRYWMNMQKFI